MVFHFTQAQTMQISASLRPCFLILLAGLLYPLGFAPFHFPGLSILSLAILYAWCQSQAPKKAAWFGLIWGLGAFGFGVSWVIISIHDYGQMNYALAALITLLFIVYLSLFPMLTAWCTSYFGTRQRPFASSLIFAAAWTLTEFARAHWMTGFPWLLTGTAMIDSPLRALAPLTGIYGPGFLAALAAACLTAAWRYHRYTLLVLFALLIISPAALQGIQWTKPVDNPLSVAVIQANLSMRDKWDEALFWHLLKLYQRETKKVIHNRVIVWPESAIPLPASYLDTWLEDMSQTAAKAGSAIIMGILKSRDENDNRFYNTVSTLGDAEGEYDKRHLVPFGEYIPAPFRWINRALGLPEPDLIPGQGSQDLITVHQRPVASLICYEIAYPELVRQQIGQAQWLISLSDNGWFGRSLASFQQQQMAQMLSLQTGRYQVLANNDGLSSIINHQGELDKSLPAFQPGILIGFIQPMQGITPWVQWGDSLCLLLIALLGFTALIRCRLSPNEPDKHHPQRPS